MTELIVCFGMWLGICGNIRVEPFPNEQACQAVAEQMRKVKEVTYAYCRLPTKPKDQS